MKPLTPLQHRVLQRIHRSPMGQRTITSLGGVYKTWPGKRGDPTIGRLAAYAIVMALKRRGLAGTFRHGNDQWASLIAYSTDEGDVEAWTPMRPPVS